MNRHLATLVVLLVLFSGTAAAQTTRGFVGISAGLQSGAELSGKSLNQWAEEVLDRAAR